jgi:hypothetical protein
MTDGRYTGCPWTRDDGPGTAEGTDRRIDIGIERVGVFS